jgi:hypothetical protein
MTKISVSHHDLKPVVTAEGNIRISISRPDVDLDLEIEMTPYEAGMHGMELITIGSQTSFNNYQRDRPTEAHP